MRHLAWAVVVALVLAASPARANVYYSIQTNITGAQTQIDVNHTSTWSFTTGVAWDFGGGTFTMKDGPATTADVVLSIYQGTNSGSPLGSIDLTHADFCAQLDPHCQSFGAVKFLFGTPLSLAANTQYFVDLTSAALDTANKQYFIKGLNSTLAFVDNQGNPIPPGYVVSETDSSGSVIPPDYIAAVSEPYSLSLVAMALASLGLVRQARRR